MKWGRYSHLDTVRLPGPAEGFLHPDRSELEWRVAEGCWVELCVAPRARPGARRAGGAPQLRRGDVGREVVRGGEDGRNPRPLVVRPRPAMLHSSEFTAGCLTSLRACWQSDLTCPKHKSLIQRGLSCMHVGRFMSSIHVRTKFFQNIFTIIFVYI